MRKLKVFAFGLVLLLALTASFPMASSPEPPKMVDIIVGFREGPRSDLVEKHGGNVAHVYNIIPAVAARLPEQAIEKMRALREVAYVEPDGEFHMLVQTLPWGVDRIDAEIVQFTDNKGTGVKIAILDTGINYNHPDLNDNYWGGIDYVNYDYDPMDDEGHGTHVAGIIAAEDNDIGIVGVAPEAHLYAVKVLDSYGSGYLSDVVLGIQWSVNNGMQIISMSLGSNFKYSSLELACDAAYNAGVLLVAAAGNDGDTHADNDVDYPARYSSVIAVAATTSNDGCWYYSSDGPEVELSAPGVNILSTYWNTYDELTGTSMACPHVTGTAALILKTTVDPPYDFDTDGAWDANEVRVKLQDTADDLGAVGRDTWYGFGLVDADGATQVEWFRGNYITPWPYAYDSTGADGVITDIVNVNSNYVALNAYIYQDYGDSSTVSLNTGQDSALTHIIGDVHARGLKVALTVFLLVKGGTWRGEIQPPTVSTWFSSYRIAVNHYADLAETNEVDLLVIGSELETLKGYNNEWSITISQARAIYFGRISYNQNWWYTAEQYDAVLDCTWFNELDYIGISGFFELTNIDDPSFDDLVSAWSYDAHEGDIVDELKNLAYTFKRLILFTEIGYRSIDGANKYPWDYTIDNSVDLQEQADCYDALFQVFHNKPWFRGTIFWAWSTDPTEGGSNDKGYVVRDKPAQTVLSDWYAVNYLPP